MARLELKTQNQILSAMIAKLLSETGVNDITPGSVILTLLEIAAKEDFNQYVQMLNVIRNYNLDTTTGQDLDNRAFEYGLTRQGAQPATGKIDILRQLGFTKVSTSLYSGLPAPVSGGTTINVNDASNPLYGTSGTLIIGRGTANEEEVTYASAPVNNVNYWTFTVSALSNDHNSDETVILKQGSDEFIPAGTVIRVLGTSNSQEIAFTTPQDVTLLAGEERVSDVNIVASRPGTIGNIPAGAITGTSAFPSPPFTGARATNLSKFTTGTDRETDEELRDRIKDHIQSLSRGTASALENAIVGATDEDTAKRVVSANIIEPTNLDEPVKIYIDDGTGFEPSFEQLGFETVLNQSTGGEERLQLDIFPLVKAQVESFNEEPYNMSSGSLSLNVSVGLDTETITFVPQDFDFPEAVTAEDIVALINDQSFLLEARTSQVGKKIVLSAIADENEDIQITGGSANSIFLFPTDRKSTLFLYIDDQLQSKDGSTAFLDTANTENYDFTTLGAGPWPLNLTVDGKTANPIVVNFASADFDDDTAATADEVAEVINERAPGVQAVVIENGTKVRLISRTQNSANSKLQVTGGSANTVLGFSTVEAVGTDRDYVLNRELGQIQLNEPLQPNQLVTTGSRFTRAKARTTSAEFYSISSGQTLVLEVDGGSPQTVTFSSTGVFSAQQVADIINQQVVGATAYSREVGTNNFLEVSTNTYEQADGSIEISSTSTASALNFTFDTLFTNQRPHKAFQSSTGTAPFEFVQNDNLIVVLDDNPASKTFNVLLDFDGAVTAASSATVFTNSNYNVIFTEDDDLNDFYLVFSSGPNTTTGSVVDVSDQGGNTFRYEFGALPTDLADFAAGDHVSFSGLPDEENNGDFIITAVNTTGNGWIEVTNPEGVDDALTSGTANLGQRRQISDYNGTSGQITVASAFANTPTVGNSFFILPSTVVNTVDYMNNTRITNLSRFANVEVANNETEIQISSKLDGSDGFVQITGGSANGELGYSTTQIQGLQGYNYYVGLVRLVHRILYGDDQDPVSFPGVLASGITAQILAPTVKQVEVNVDVTLTEGASLSNVDQEVRSAITGYINNLGVGEDVIVAELCDRIIGVTNVRDVEIIEPAVNIAIEDNELARTTTNLITVS